MIALPLSLASRRVLRSDFVPEWCGIGFVLAGDAIWAMATSFRITASWHDGLLLTAALVMMLGLRAFSIARGGLIAEYFALTAAATAAFGVLSYLAMAHGAPLVDTTLQRIDLALGFDWHRWFLALFAHPWAVTVFKLLYDSLVYQGLYFALLLGLLDRKGDLREMFWLVFVAGLFTSAGAFLWPALGPFKQYGLISHGPFVPVMEHLLRGRNLTFALHDMTGVVSFPSFHTTMALAYMWGFRRTGAIGWTVVAMNVGMLLAIPFFGGHYLIDMIAGAALMLVSLGVVKFGSVLIPVVDRSMDYRRALRV